MKHRFRAPTLFCLMLLSFLMLNVKIALNPPTYAQHDINPDTMIKGVVKEVQYDYQGVYSGGTYKLTALIVVEIAEISQAPETFGREIGDLVAVSYNYSSYPECKVNDCVAVYGLWVPILDVPASLTIRVDDNIFRSYVMVYYWPLAPLPVDTEIEYSNGSIPLSEDENLWYTWINSMGTQVVFLTYSDVFVIPFVGECYKVSNDTDVFIGNMFIGMELYNDSNGNGVPEANFTAGIGEIKYYFLVTSSEGFTPISIQKIMVNQIPHYTWGVRYETLDGILLYSEDLLALSMGKALEARVVLSHLAFTYDYYIQKNATYLKTGLEIGEITSIEPSDSNTTLTLDGLSLSLLYETITVTTNPYTVFVGGQPYNSTTAKTSAVLTNRAEVRLKDIIIYEFLFGENYTLYRDSLMENYESKSIASSTDSIPPDFHPWLPWAFEDAVWELFPKISEMQADVNLDYAVSTFLYRVCYPVWEGHHIEHDPTYVAYITPKEGPQPPPSPPTGPSLELITGVAIVSLIALVVAVLDLRKTRQILKISPFVRTL